MDDEVEPLEVDSGLTQTALVGAGRANGLYGDSRLIEVGGDTLEVEPVAGGLFDFLGRLLAPFVVPFCCCCCCCLHFARRFLNQT